MKKIVILQGSPRKGGNTDLLADEFARGAETSGHQVEKIYLADKNIHPCIACNACRRNGGNCVFQKKDDFESIVQAVIETDILVLSSPVYFYSLTAQMKTAVDRFYARENEVKNKTAYFITASAAPTEEHIQTAVACYQGFISCFKNIRDGGIIAGCGASEKGDVTVSACLRGWYGRINELLWQTDF